MRGRVPRCENFSRRMTIVQAKVDASTFQVRCAHHSRVCTTGGGAFSSRPPDGPPDSAATRACVPRAQGCNRPLDKRIKVVGMGSCGKNAETGRPLVPPTKVK